MDFDVVVSGSGLTGTATALALHNQGLRVALIEASEPKSSKGQFGHDLRTLALSPANLNWLKSLNIGDGLPSHPVERMHIWEHDGSGHVTFDSSAVGLQSLATVFEHTPLIETCRATCQRHLELLESTRIESIDNTERSLRLSNEREISCRLLCIAEGPNSNTRGLAGSICTSKFLGQSALVTLAKTSNGHGNTAWQKFGDGILAFLPFKDNLVSVIWSMNTVRCEQLIAMERSKFERLLARTSERVCGEVVEVDERKSFPLHQTLANTFSPKPWIAILGDAAHTLHPLSGQGVNLGLEDARSLIKCLEIQTKSGFDTVSLAQFAQQRRWKARMMIHAMSFFLNTWSWDRPEFRWFRNIGVRTFNRMDFLKHQVMREAIGYGPLGTLD